MAIDVYAAFRARRDAFISRCLLHLLVARVYTLLGCVVPPPAHLISLKAPHLCSVSFFKI